MPFEYHSMMKEICKQSVKNLSDGNFKVFKNKNVSATFEYETLLIGFE